MHRAGGHRCEGGFGKCDAGADEMKRDFFAGKTVLIMGLGRFGGGVDVARFAADAGAKVIVTDIASAEQLTDSLKHLEEFPQIEYHLGSHEVSDFQRADIIIANPAVPNDNKFLKAARKAGKLVTSQINIFFELCPAVIIGITGANGKSTTAALTAHLLRSTSDQRPATSDQHVWLSGNIGNEPLLTIADQISPSDLVVLELSSFQLEQLAQARKAPNIAVLTNLTPNHLDRYGTFAEYCDAKENIFKFQKLDKRCPAVSVFNAEDKIAVEWFEKYKPDSGRVCLKFSADDVSEEIRAVFPLPGRANLSNLAAGLCIAGYLCLEDKQFIKSLPAFRALPHRLEFVAEFGGIKWYNDSKATTPPSGITAIEAFDQPLIIIAGGYDKNIPFDEFGSKIAEKTKAAILIGATAQKIACAIKSFPHSQTEIKFAQSLRQAVELAGQIAAGGDVVLLSPACASYDMFENYQQRGLEFTRLVQQLASRL
jgi:UDP-N-acetylmuramoylalanine--D-glutamate ligase